MLTREQLLSPAARTRPVEPLTLPGLEPGFCCGMDGAEDAEFQGAWGESEKKDYRGPPLKAVALCYLLCDERGGRLLSPDDALGVAALPSRTLTLAWQKFLALNGLGKEEQEAFRKNSGGGPTSGSGTSSPSPGAAPSPKPSAAARLVSSDGG